MFLWRVFVLLCSVADSLSAEEFVPKTVYNKSSQQNMANINKTVEFIRDPTKGLGNSVDKLTNKVKSKLPSLPIIPQFGNYVKPVTSPTGLHDPTQMSGNFRQALKAYNPPKTTGEATSVVGLPEINLVGKVFIPRDLKNPDKNQETSSVVLGINGKTHHFKEGGRGTILVNDQIVTVSVVQITRQLVTLRLSPSNEILQLH